MRSLSFVLLLGAACSSNPATPAAGGVAGASGGQPNAGGTPASSAGAATTGGGGANGGSAGAVAGAASAGASGASSAGSGGQAGAGPVGPSGLPIPPGAADVPKPVGNAANLQVVPWAGFSGAVTYTFDDSQPSQFEHWPELKAAGAPVTYFITTSANYITDYDKILKEVVAAGGELGNHTVNHCNFDLTGCATHLATAEQEMDGCSEYITSQLGQPDSLTIAYPYGDTGYLTASKPRFFLGRGVGGGVGGGFISMGDANDPFNLPIIAAQGGEAADVFNGHIDTAHTQNKWVIFLFHSLAPTQAAYYATLDIGSVTGSIAHAKALPDLWLDTMANVGAYWLGERLLEGAGPTWTWTLPAHFPAGKYLRVTVDGGSLKQGDTTLAWDAHGYYEVALDAGTLSWTE